MIDAFVSYSHKDEKRVRPLVAALQSNGHRIWWDRDIPPGCNYQREIEQALSEASCVMIMLTRNSAGSDWVQGETSFGQDQKKLIPVLLDDVPVPVSMRSLQLADLRHWPDKSASAAAFQQLLDCLNARAQSQARLTREFVGRGEALASLQKGFARALKGAGSLVTVSGEPGIGKTRCAEECAQAIEDQGGLVLWGRCYEQSGAPPYWPWVQILREYASANSDDELRVALGSSGEAIATLVPELSDRLGIPSRNTGQGGKPEESFRIFDAVTRLLTRHSRDVPLALILDDLHWADESSLALLEFIVKALPQQRILIVCTYRDAEVTRKSLLLATLGELARSRHVDRIRLSGLDQSETARLASAVSGLELRPDIVDAIFRQTDGNPLFVEEVARVVATEHAAASGQLIAIDVPDGIREAIGRRLDRLSAECNELLAVASVLGREFDIRVVIEVLGTGLEDALEHLAGAFREGLLQRHGAGLSTYRFTHAVIRETIYDELPTLERLRGHQRVAAAMAKLHAGKVEPVLSQLAHHYREAAALGDFESAVDVALQAAAYDVRLYALEDACLHYDMALQTLLENGCEGDPRTAETCFRKGRVALTAGKIPQAIDSLARGVELARMLGDASLFTDCILVLVMGSSHLPQHQTVPLLKEALSMLPEADLNRRASTLASLAFALRSTTSVDEAGKVGQQAIALARESADPAILARVLRVVCMALRGHAETLKERVRHGTEALQLCENLKDQEDIAECCYWHLLNLVEDGQITAAEALLSRYAHHSSHHHLHRHEYQARLLRAALCLLHGEWEAAERRINDALEQGLRLNRHEAEGVYGAQMFLLNRDLGRLRSMRPAVQRVLEQHRSSLWEPGLMLMCCETGLADRARAALHAVAGEDFSSVPRDDMWLICMVFCAEACAHLGDMARASVLYELLEPYKRQTANHPTAICLGSVAGHLGLLAELIGRKEAARSHFEHSIAKNRAMRAWPALARSQFWLARMLLTSKVDESHDEARKLLADAEQLAARFSMAGLLADIGRQSAEPVQHYPDGLTAREIEVLQLLAIGRSNKDISAVLSISLSTVATHVRSILSKTGCANRTEAAAYANRRQLN
jgi:ATP/maltotriose-dependent transcriptional regulator MalT